MVPSFPPASHWKPTLDTLSQYAKAVGVVPRALATPHPRWWHISLKVNEKGATTDLIPIQGSNSEIIQLLLNLQDHTLDLSTSRGIAQSIPMTGGASGSEFGDRLLSVLGKLDIKAEFEREVFEDDDPRSYEPEAAALYHRSLLATADTLERHRTNLDGTTGPVQLWPHNFDLAFEWFGTLIVSTGDGGAQPAQINFGLAPGDSSHPETYFYSNPWPFQETLLNSQRPPGASWFTESWQGSVLPYAEIAGDPDGSNRLAAYFQAIYNLASPLLTA